MNKQTIKKKPDKITLRIRPQTSSKALIQAFLLSHGRRAVLIGGEVLPLVGTALVAVIAALGRAAESFSGVGLWSSLVPFAGMVLVLAVVLFLAFKLWMKIRTPLVRRSVYLPALTAVVVALGTGWFSSGREFHRDLVNLRLLVGGVQEAERTTLSHQVYAAYRRTDLAQMQALVERAKPYEAAIREAASIYGVDAEVLMGVGAAESSFLPRDSKDGGRGLFQITSPPKEILERVGKQLGDKPLDWRNTRHNALLGAATWRHYQKEMRNDLFLSLLAYNIGPKNGGLLSIMRLYGARDFATIQPYLQNLPRDYPIRVLTAALAFRLHRLEGHLPRYEEGDNAMRIQRIGIPGLSKPG
ncbi:MAG: transglycosylase SLT domain-containing protein [Candidatus Methylumidiphilus sp.]